MLECSATIMVVNDSNANLMYSGTLGVGYKLFDRVNTGIEFGMASRVVYGMNLNNEWTGTSERHPIGFFMPKVEVNFDWWMFNIGWIPPVNTSGLIITQAVYLNFGIKL